MANLLENIRVIDWTVWQQGPIAAMMLGDLGAEVIKIEEYRRGDPGRGTKRAHDGHSRELGDSGRSSYFEVNNRNKKGMAVNLKKEKGQEIIYRLVEKSDVFLHNFRPESAKKLGLDYETLSKYNSRLIYANATGYGSKGPESSKIAFDYTAQARSGLMLSFGEPDTPPLYGVGGIADQIGGIFLAYGVLGALFARERLGVGQEIEVSLLSSMMWTLGLNVSEKLLLGAETKRLSRHTMKNPLWNHYQCKDGKWVCLAMLQSDRYWDNVCKALGIVELSADERFRNMDKRAENSQELIAILDQAFITKTCDEVERAFQEEGVIYQKVQNISDVVQDPQVLANGYVADYLHPVLGNVKMLSCPVTFSQTPASVRFPAPEFGQHTEEVLNELLGYSWEKIIELKDEEVI
jgi:crotonobetainyl-CoA:carnitine CoA-transferase CaiB-like acyl-CoA transferase